MIYDYSALASTAARLLTRFGRQLALRETNVIGGDPWAPELGQTDTPVVGVIRDYRLEERGDLIPAGDQLAIIDGTATPTVAQKLIDGLTEFEIVSVTQAKPGDTVLVYFCQVRK